MSLKYLIEYVDLVQIPHRIEIDDPLYIGSVVNVNGFATMIYSNTNNPLEVIRGSSLRIDLDADTSLTFEDLYTDGQKKIKVKYLRNAVLKFEGWINPEGWYEDYVNDKWVVGFDCVDGLGYLKDLAFVYDNGTNVITQMTLIKLLSIALKRTGLNLQMIVDIDTYYVGRVGLPDPLYNVQADPNRFIKDDGDTISDCDEVIRSLLKIFTACITSKDGAWYIYQPNNITTNPDREFFIFDTDGNFIEPVNINLSATIGSDINKIPIHFVNENQSISLVNSIGAYRINYEYGLKLALLGNPNLGSSNGIIPGWTIETQTNFSIPTSELGFNLRIIVSPIYIPILQLKSDDVIVAKSDLIDITFIMNKVWISGVPISQYNPFRIELKVILVTNTTTYWLELDRKWHETDTIMQIKAVDSIFFNDLLMPDDGDLRIEVWTPVNRNSFVAEWDLHFSKIHLSPSKDQFQGVIGEFHDFQRKNNPSAKVEPIREVMSGDGNSDIYVGVLKKPDGTPTTFWHREAFPDEELPILQLMGLETLKMTPKPARIFTGDIYGFIDYLSLVTIDGLGGKWMPIGYSYDTRANIISLKLREVFNDELGDDISYALNYNYGNTVKPTIVG